MTDAEINALAQEIAQRVATDINEIAPEACRLNQKADGSPFLEFVGTSKLGWGSFKCAYDPLPPIKTLIAESEKIYDEFEVTLTNKRTNETSVKRLGSLEGEDRAKIIGLMARVAGLYVVGAVYPRLTEMIGDGFHDGKLMAEATLIMAVASSPDTEDEILSYAKTDMTDAVEAAASDAASRRKKFLEDRLQSAPYVIAARGPGRKPKTVYQLKHETADYTAAVEAAYKTQRIAAGCPPTKTSIAEALGEGGINPNTGGDSRLNTFNLKLARLGVNYDEIAQGSKPNYTEIQNSLLCTTRKRPVQFCVGTQKPTSRIDFNYEATFCDLLQSYWRGKWNGKTTSARLGRRTNAQNRKAAGTQDSRSHPCGQIGN
jgi:hypothetical protein